MAERPCDDAFLMAVSSVSTLSSSSPYKGQPLLRLTLTNTLSLFLARAVIPLDLPEDVVDERVARPGLDLFHAVRAGLGDGSNRSSWTRGVISTRPSSEIFSTLVRARSGLDRLLECLVDSVSV